jgi:hypothetical protein
VFCTLCDFYRSRLLFVLLVSQKVRSALVRNRVVITRLFSTSPLLKIKGILKDGLDDPLDSTQEIDRGATRAKVCEALCSSMMISSLLGLGGRLYAMLAVDRLPLGKKMLAVEAKLALIIFLLALVYLHR